MKFRLEKVIPLPMVEIPTEDSDIWEADSFVFRENLSYLAEAASGKGKTSLLSILYGLRTDFTGEVYMDDISLATLNLKDWSRIRSEKLSYIFQGLELFDELSAIENINLKNQLTGHKSAAQINEMAEKLGVAPFLSKKSKFLSFGQKQRVAIIRALCQPFEFLLADECFSHIDRENSLTAFSLITEECKMQKAGLILTSLGNGLEDFDERIRI